MATSGRYDALTQACFRLLTREPFYGHLFTGLLREVSEQVRGVSITLAPGGQLRIRVNPKEWETWSDDQQVGALKHNLLHAMLHHPQREEGFRHRRLYWIAADLVVNQYLNTAQLADGAVTLADFPSMEPDKDVAWYYARLSHVLSQGASEDGEGSDEARALDALLRDGGATPSALDEHSTWAPIAALPRAEQRVIDQGILDALYRTIKRVKTNQYGALPAGLRIVLDGMLAARVPQVNWRRVVRLFSASSRRTRVKNTLRRPSKRYGTTPGIKVQREQRLLVAIDTSGSVSEVELRTFFSEVYHLWRAGAEVRVVECDTAIHATWDYRGVPPAGVHGGGGTSFTPPIRYANERYGPDAILYFTDGYAEPPAVVSRCPILWIISSQGLAAGSPGWAQLPDRKVKLTL
ncbi:MAG: hypothetical protein H6739_24645 [Alphaproteobacteria bacterium]|nr:hypothetical protein [Alphaproteobacteria bacterium]